MEKEYFNSEYACISFSKSKKTVELTWKQEVKDVRQYGFALSKTLVLIKQHDIKRWITDMSLKKNTTEEEKDWLEKFFLPNIEKVGLEKLAFVTPEFLSPSKERVISLLEAAKGKNVEIRLFRTMEKARKWIEK